MNTSTDQQYSDAKEQIRSRMDIAQLIGRYIKLKPAGQNLKGLCPFHKEKTPSFTVSPAKEVFHCFGCGKGGDIFAFIMEMEGISFPEAMQRLADETGVAISGRQYTAPGPGQNHIAKPEALKIHEIAALYFYNQIKNNPKAIDYFKARGLKPETVKEFRLGFAPEGWSNLTEHLVSKKIGVDKLMACGLTLASSQGGSHYDRFRNRIIFPIFDISGRVIAFAGRSMDNESMPKYLNSPETVLYHKNRLLYGLHHARSSIKETGFVIFVEGYMDFLSLYQAGIQNVVATSGTALSEEHGHLIRRFTSKIVLVFDGDAAGVNAAERAVFILAPLNLDVRVLVLPGEEDPDSYIRSAGRGAFEKCIAGADDTAAFIMKRALSIHKPDTPAGKSAVVEYLMPLLQATGDSIVKAALIKKIAEQLDIKEQLVYARIPRRGQGAPAEQNPLSGNRLERFIETEEGSFLHIIIQEPSLIETAQKYLTLEIFSDLFTKNLYSLITDTYKDDRSLKSIVQKTENTDLKGVLSLMLVKEVASENHRQDISHKVKRFLLKSNKLRMHENTVKLRNERNPDIRKKLLLEQINLLTQRGDLVKEW